MSNNNNISKNNNSSSSNSDDEEYLSDLESFSPVEQASSFDFSAVSASLYTTSNLSMTSIVDLDGAELPAYVFRRRNAIIEESDEAPKAGAYVDYLP